ncbi:MAG TPA: hypothetical protein VMT35_10145 [Ignavibacteriaceae bacterium]|nr:hypothetical protein [Ignavibacteriaceae bacterium]
MSSSYKIKVHGCLPYKFSKWLNNLHIKNLKEDETLIEGNVEDQAALFGILMKIRDLGLQLIYLEKVDDDKSAKGDKLLNK